MTAHKMAANRLSDDIKIAATDADVYRCATACKVNAIAPEIKPA
jgi:hypothetical protein